MHKICEHETTDKPSTLATQHFLRTTREAVI